MEIDGCGPETRSVCDLPSRSDRTRRSVLLRARRSELGAVSVEYTVAGAAILVVLSALVAFTGVGQRAGDTLSYLVCKSTSVVSQASCSLPGSTSGPESDGDPDGLRPGDPGYNGQTPLEQATEGDYVSIGDSYSSGEGAGDYIEGTNGDTLVNLNECGRTAECSSTVCYPSMYSAACYGVVEGNKCHQSENAYSAVIYSNNPFAGDYSFGACSGAIRDDYLNDSHDPENANQGPQQSYMTDDTSLVTMSMGGNDFGFAPVLENCVKGNCFVDRTCKPSGRSQTCSYAINEESLAEKEQEIYDQIWGVTDDDGNKVSPGLVDLWDDMRADAGDDTRIMIIGYPQMFPDDPTNSVGGGLLVSMFAGDINPTEQEAINQLANYINNQLAAAATTSGANVEYVDVTDALEGHEAGTKDPWIHDVDGIVGQSQESFHPTAEGNAAMAAILQQYLEEGRR